jgi:Flp pilus assembly protein CpaB
MAAAAAIAFVTTVGSHGRTTGGYAVASRRLAAGAVISPGDTTLARVGLPGATASSSFARPADLVGRTLAEPVAQGELIEASMLAPSGASSSLRPVTVSVDPVSAAGLVPGDTVDVLAVAIATGGGDASSGSVAVVLRGASLISIDSSGGNTLGSTGSSIATLGVTSLSEVEALVGASHSGVVSLVKAETSDGVGAGAASPNTPVNTTDKAS